MAKITITVDTSTNSLQANVDGQNISNIYDICVYKRDASPYYDASDEESDNYCPLEVSFSVYEKTDSSVTSKRTTYAKDQVVVEENIDIDNAISTELSKILGFSQ